MNYKNFALPHLLIPRCYAWSHNCHLYLSFAIGIVETIGCYASWWVQGNCSIASCIPGAHRVPRTGHHSLRRATWMWSSEGRIPEAHRILSTDQKGTIHWGGPRGFGGLKTGRQDRAMCLPQSAAWRGNWAGVKRWGVTWVALLKRLTAAFQQSTKKKWRSSKLLFDSLRLRCQQRFSKAIDN